LGRPEIVLHLGDRFERVHGAGVLLVCASFQRALRLLSASIHLGAAPTTATICGYADQAHFVRDFRAFAGCAPGEHLLRRAELNGFFSSRPR
jgi:AraC-like DNA-binding protein